jgi:uncharacterized protein YvpB
MKFAKQHKITILLLLLLFGIFATSYFFQLTKSPFSIESSYNTPQSIASSRAILPVRGAILPKYVIFDVPLVKQAHRASCELASTRAVMLYYGIDISEDKILSDIGVDNSPRYFDSNGKLHWGNPQQAFVGNFDAPIIYVDGYGVYNQPIKKYLDSHGFSRSISKQHWDVTELLNFVKEGNPVIVWISSDYQKKYVQTWIAPDGSEQKWFVGEHAVVIRGVDDNNVYIMDVGNGTYTTISIDRFSVGFSNLDNMAIVVIKDPA